MEENDRIICVSCGRTLVGPSGQGIWYWGHSHCLPVGQYKHLESDPENFKPRCQNWEGKKGCHEHLDDRDFAAIAKFHDLDQIMKYRLEHDKEAYNQFVTGLNEANVNPGYAYCD